MKRLRALRSPALKEIRGRGLWIGIELHAKARPYCEALKTLGMQPLGNKTPVYVNGQIVGYKDAR